MSTVQVSLMSRLWPCHSSFAYIKSGQTRSVSGNKMSIDRTTVLPRLCIKLLCTEHDLWVVSLNWLAGRAPSWHKVSSRMVWLCQNVHPVNEWVFVGVGDEWRVELVEKDGQKSPAGISYKLHCNLLVLFLLFISRSKLEKQRENWGIFMTLWKELVTKTHINWKCILMIHVFWTINTCCKRNKLPHFFQSEFDNLIKTRTCSFVMQF